MSRAFVNEDNHQEAPIIRPRADLPEGVTNYVTPNGFQALLDEKEALLLEQKNLENRSESELRSMHTVINGKLQMLDLRIASARIIDPETQPKDTIHFSANVLMQILPSDKTQQFQIVGVDEADLKKGKIAFTSPLAKALSLKKAGDIAELHLAHGTRSFKILSISY
ncbi:MAG TPA: GreA/GreB family elongation factor [Bacteroidales bacterium]|nr:GreA/GreB family elongation factor [Bacteroidales bacterium]